MKKLAMVVLAATAAIRAQSPAPPLQLTEVIDFPFPDNLVAAPRGAAIAWTLNEQGARNIYVAEGPDFQARRVTPYPLDDGQELTSLAFTPDGKSIVYVRGGDHGANWPAEGNLQPNPAGGTTQPRVQLWSVWTTGTELPRLLGEGDDPAISKNGKEVAFVRDGRIWTAPLDGSKPAEQAFFARGRSQSPVYTDDGRIAFVSNRDDHSFIGIFEDAKTPIRYLSPSTGRDTRPLWSLEAGREVVFVRQPGRGGTPTSSLVQQPQPWSIMVVEAAQEATGGPNAPPPSAFESWTSGRSLVDSIPRDVRLQWAAGDRIVYVSYQDGWPHLYAIQHPGEGGKPVLLTPGAFMVEHVTVTPDGAYAIYSANTGADRHDIDRRHLFKVAVDGSAPPIPLTSGDGIEWAPAVTGDGQTIAFLRSTAQRPPLPAVMPIAGGRPRDVGAERLRASYPSARLVPPEPVTFAAADGVTIHAQLFKTPAGDSMRPALVYVHGGPVRQMLIGFHYMDYYANDYALNQFLASRGFIVLSVNYRLGVGYGHTFQFPDRAGARGAAEYQDVVAAGKYLQGRPDVDRKRIGIWGGSYGGYLTALALGRNSDIFAAGVDIHGVHNWDRFGSAAPNIRAAYAGDGLTETEIKRIAQVQFESSPVSAVKTWKSPVLLIHADDDRNVEFHQTVDLKQRLLERGVVVEELVIPDDIHDFLLWRSWKTVTAAVAGFFERRFFPASATSR